MSVTPEQPPRPQTQISVRVRYPECDPMNVAHHSVYAIWFEMARTDLLRETGVSYKELEAQDVLFVVTKLSITYKQPAFYDDDLTVRVWVSEMSRVRIDHGYEIRRGSTLIATAESTLACVDRQGRVRAIPPAIAGEGE